LLVLTAARATGHRILRRRERRLPDETVVPDALDSEIVELGREAPVGSVRLGP
jgi:hypothetical protein